MEEIKIQFEDDLYGKVLTAMERQHPIPTDDTLDDEGNVVSSVKKFTQAEWFKISVKQKIIEVYTKDANKEARKNIESSIETAVNSAKNQVNNGVTVT